MEVRQKAIRGPAVVRYFSVWRTRKRQRVTSQHRHTHVQRSHTKKATTTVASPSARSQVTAAKLLAFHLRPKVEGAVGVPPEVLVYQQLFLLLEELAAAAATVDEHDLTCARAEGHRLSLAPLQQRRNADDELVLPRGHGAALQKLLIALLAERRAHDHGQRARVDRRREFLEILLDLVRRKPPAEKDVGEAIAALQLGGDGVGEVSVARVGFARGGEHDGVVAAVAAAAVAAESSPHEAPGGVGVDEHEQGDWREVVTIVGLFRLVLVLLVFHYCFA